MAGKRFRAEQIIMKLQRTAHHVETHQLTPVIGVFALLKRRKRADQALVQPNELALMHGCRVTRSDRL